MNIFAADPYVSIVLAARMYRTIYIKDKIKDDEDAQTVYGAEPDDADLPAQRLSA